MHARINNVEIINGLYWGGRDSSGITLSEGGSIPFFVLNDKMNAT
jgi:hypothetical protein